MPTLSPNNLPAHPLFFVRHGETDWNAKNLFQGMSDTMLTLKGEGQAQANAELLAPLISNPIETSITTSPLKRARATATIIADKLNVNSPPKPMNTFREIAMGDWEGMTTWDVKEKTPELRRTRKADRWHFRAPNGESMADRADEIRAALQTLSPHTILVSHCVVLRVLLHLLNDCDKNIAALTNMPHEGIWLWDGQKMSLQGA